MMANKDLDRCARLLADIMDTDRVNNGTVKFKLSRVNNQTVSSKAKTQRFRKKKPATGLAKKPITFTKTVPRLCHSSNPNNQNSAGASHAKSTDTNKQAKKKPAAVKSGRQPVVIPTAESSLDSSVQLPNSGASSPRQLNKISQSQNPLDKNESGDSYVRAPAFNQRLMSSTPQRLDDQSAQRSAGQTQGHPVKFSVYSTSLAKPQAENESFMFKPYHAPPQVNHQVVSQSAGLQMPVNLPVTLESRVVNSSSVTALVMDSVPSCQQTTAPIVQHYQHAGPPHYQQGAAQSNAQNLIYSSANLHVPTTNQPLVHMEPSSSQKPLATSVPPPGVTNLHLGGNRSNYQETGLSSAGTNLAFQKEVISDTAYSNYARVPASRLITSAGNYKTSQPPSQVRNLDYVDVVPVRDVAHPVPTEENLIGSTGGDKNQANAMYSLYSSVNEDRSCLSEPRIDMIAANHQEVAQHLRKTLGTQTSASTISKPVSSSGQVCVDSGQSISDQNTTESTITTTVTNEIPVSQIPPPPPDVTPVPTPTRSPVTTVTDHGQQRQVQFDVAVDVVRNTEVMKKGLDTPPSSPSRDDHTQGHPRKASPCNVKASQRTLSYLLKELRAVSSISGDLEVERLVGEIEQVADRLQPTRLALDVQTEIDLSLQPMRSENAQLRRRLRILNQQIRDQENQDKKEIDIDISIKYAQVEALNASLQKQVQEEKTRKDALLTKCEELQKNYDKEHADKLKMLEAVSIKESDSQKCRQDYTGEISRIQQELNTAVSERDSLQRHLEAAERDKHITDIVIQQKDREISRLQDLVRGLQKSMSSLLHDIECSQPAHDTSRLYSSVNMKELSKLLSEEQINSKEEISPPHTVMPKFSPFSLKSTSFSQSGILPKSSATPARRSLDFNEKSARDGGVRLQTLTEEAVSQHNQDGGQNGWKLDATKWNDFLEHLRSKLELKPADGNTEPLVNNYVGASSEGDMGTTLSSRQDDVPVSYTAPAQPQLYANQMKDDNYTAGGETESSIHGNKDIPSNQQIIRAVSMTSSLSSLDDKLTAEMESNFSGVVLTGQHTAYGRSSLDTVRSAELSSGLVDVSDPVKSSGYSEQTPDTVKSRLLDSDIYHSHSRSTSSRPPSENVHYADHSRRPPVGLNQSRYSVTDYFKKYPQAAVSGTYVRDSESDGDLKQTYGENYVPLGDANMVNRSVPQNATFQGTQLDTSLSAIDDTQSVVTETTVSTAWTVDDQAFRNGLASLDANIARIQQKLRENKLGRN